MVESLDRRVRRRGALASALSLAAVLVAAHHPAALPALGFLVGAAQWSEFRRVGLGSGWIWATGVGWLGALVAMALVGRWLPDTVLVAALAVLVGGAVLAAAQRLAVRRLGWRGRVVLLTAGGFALSWSVALLFDRYAGRLPLGAPGESLAMGAGYPVAHYLGALVAGAPLVALGVIGLRRGRPAAARGGRFAPLAPIVVIVLFAGSIWQIASLPNQRPRSLTGSVAELRHVEATLWFEQDAVEAVMHRFEVADDVPLFAYLLRPADRPARALVLFVPGSGAQSAQGFARRRLAPLVREWGVAVATLDRPGVAPSEETSPKATELFHAYDDKRARVVCARSLLDHVVSEHGWEQLPIGLIGYSEGVDVTAQLARDDRRVRAAALLAGGGYNAADEARVGFYGLVRTRSAALDPVVQRVIDLYVWRHARRILANPTPERRLLGLSFRRWASYIVSAPIDDLLDARHARFLSIHGERDGNVPLEAARYIERRFRAHGRDGHSLQVRPGLDHSFRDAQGRDHLPEVLSAATGWILDEIRR